MRPKRLVQTAGAVLFIVAVYYVTRPEHTIQVRFPSPPVRKEPEVVRVSHPPLPAFHSRNEIGNVLEQRKYRVGAELGVQTGIYANELLKRWPSFERMYLIDSWRHLDNYQDMSNVPQDKHIARMCETATRLQQYGNRTIMIRTTIDVAAEMLADDSLDFVYVDARHDYPSVLHDMGLFWPKIRPGGIMAGHDYVDQDVLDRLGGNDHWNIGPDGTNYGNKAVKSAVNEFAASVARNVVVVGDPGFPSWLIQK